MVKESAGATSKQQGKDKSRSVPRKSSTASKSTNRSKRNPRPPRSVRSLRNERSRPVVPSRSGVSITLQIPSLKRPRPRDGALQAPGRIKYWQIAIVPVAVVALTAVLALVRPSSESTTADIVAIKVERTEPDFRPLVPSAAEASATTYDSKRNMVSYTTTFSGTRLTVSQQPLPAQFKTDPKVLKAAVDSINAKQRLDTAKGPIYIATNETNDQLAIFAGTQVLLFIHTDRTLDDTSWKSFIELLKIK